MKTISIIFLTIITFASALKANEGIKAPDGDHVYYTEFTGFKVVNGRYTNIAVLRIINQSGDLSEEIHYDFKTIKDRSDFSKDMYRYLWSNREFDFEVTLKLPFSITRISKESAADQTKVYTTLGTIKSHWGRVTITKAKRWIPHPSGNHSHIWVQ